MVHGMGCFLVRGKGVCGGHGWDGSTDGWMDSIMMKVFFTWRKEQKKKARFFSSSLRLCGSGWIGVVSDYFF